MDKMKNTQGVMINVITDVDRFVGIDDPSTLVKHYKEKFDQIKDKIYQLAHLEELILQDKCMADPDIKIKLSLLREYVYARCPFYRNNKSTKDIRVILGRVDLLDPTNPNPSLDDLYNNPDVMSTSKVKLTRAMLDEFRESSNRYHELYD